MIEFWLDMMLQAMFIDFGLAKERGGHCLLRFDDTNPTAEKQEYIDHIEDICSWLGWAPVKVRQLGQLGLKQLWRKTHTCMPGLCCRRSAQHTKVSLAAPWPGTRPHVGRVLKATAHSPSAIGQKQPVQIRLQATGEPAHLYISQNSLELQKQQQCTSFVRCLPFYLT